MYPAQPIKLEDCSARGPGTELFVVEGDSAAGIVSRMRDAQWQAVLPMQGKPLNTVRATPKKVVLNPWFKALTDAIGANLGDEFDLSRVRYERVMLLMDADADGIHCGALLLMFFHRWMRPLLEAGRVMMVRAPLAEITTASPPRAMRVHSEMELRSVMEQIRARGILDAQTRRYRGLAGIDPDILAITCVRPESRYVDPMSVADAAAAIAVFSRVPGAAQS